MDGNAGDVGALFTKRDVAERVRGGEPPLDNPSFGRAQRLARRAALRQLAHTGAPADALAAWRDAFDTC